MSMHQVMHAWHQHGMDVPLMLWLHCCDAELLLWALSVATGLHAVNTAYVWRSSRATQAA